MTWFQHELIDTPPGIRLRDLLVKYVTRNGTIGSQKEAKRIIRQGGVKIDDVGIISDIDYRIFNSCMVRIGRRRVFEFKVTQ